MSKRHLFHPEDNEGPVIRYPSSSRRGISSDFRTMTTDRNKPSNGEKFGNPYGTLPRELKAPLPNAKIQAVSAFTNLWNTQKQSSVIEEDLQYLQAVESGNLDLVEEILLKNKIGNLESDEDDSRKKKKNAPSSKKTTAKKNATSSAPAKSPQVLKRNGNGDIKGRAKSESPVVLEMVDIQEAGSATEAESPPRIRAPIVKRTSCPNLKWKKAAAANSPLPVTMTRTNNSMRRSKDTLKVIGSSPGIARSIKVKFNKNCRDEWGRTAIFIAMIHHNLDMLDLLLRYKVDVEECLYHAIDFGYYEVVELFMKYDTDTSQMITGDDSFYPPGLTPFQLAAHKNDYVMLKILYSHGYRIPDERKKRGMLRRNSDANHWDNKDSTSSVLDRAWDATNNQILYYRAIASSAYMILLFNEGLESGTGNWDFMDNIFSLYGRIKKKVSNEPTARSLYLPLADQVEEFACDLLSEIRSSSDLASLLRFDPPGQPRSTSPRNCLTPVQRAIEVRMKRFVAHDNSQLAISALRQGTLFDSEYGWRTTVTRMCLALVFPFLCLAFAVAPDSKVGALLCNPIVNMTCHIMSEVLFLVLMILRLILLTFLEKCDCLGMAVYTIDWIILMWVLARIVNQIKRAREISLKEMILNVWSLNDLAVSTLFILVIILKIYDVAKFDRVYPGQCQNFQNDSVLKRHCTRGEWTAEEAWPVTIAETALAFIYLLIHIRAMELLYTDRTFGPLQLSLDKMLVDTIRFLIIFSVTFFAFAFAMTQLYWAWGRPTRFLYGESVDYGLCEQDQADGNPCHPVYSFIQGSLLEQYWTLYGYGWGEEPPSATKIPEFRNKSVQSKGATEIAGQAVSMVFHVWAVVVMLNMLVAMMSHSFERVRNNAELEWKFHRSGMWMKFIRKGVYPRPPPMNLVPSTRDIKSFYFFIKKRILKRCCQTSSPSRHNARREVTQEGSQRDNSKYRQALTNITQRYMRRYLLPDFRHDEIDQVNRNNMGRRVSVIGIGDEESSSHL